MLKEKWEAVPYRIKILLELTIMSILPILVFTVYSYYVIRVDMVDKMDLMSSRRVEKVEERTDRILTSIWESYFEIFMADSVNSAMTQKLSYQDYSIYSDVITKMEGQIYLRDYIRGFSFINLETDWVLSNRGMYPFSEANNQEEILEVLGTDYQRGKLINSGREAEGSLHHNTIDASGVYMLFELPVASATPKCIVIINLNMDAFQEFVDDKDGYEITILDKDNRLILATDEVTADYLCMQREALEEQSWFIRDDRQKIRIGTISTDSDYFQYIVTYDSRLVGEEGRRIIGFAFFLMAVLLATGIAVILTGKRVYQPILNLTDRISNMVQSEEKGNKDAIWYIESNIQSMMSTIRSQKNEMIKYLMSRLLSGTIQEDEIQSCMTELNLKNYPDYCIMALSPGTDSKWSQEMERNLLLKAVEESMMAEFDQREILASRVWNRSLIFLIGASASDGVEEKIMRIEKAIQPYLRENGIDEMQLGASRIFNNLEHTMRAYHEALEAVKVSGIESSQNGSPRLILYEDIAQSMKHTAFYPVSAEGKIRELVDECKEKEACMEAGRLVDDLYENRMPSVERRYYLYRLLFTILEVQNDAGLFISEVKPWDGNDLLFSFSQLYGNEDIKNFICLQIIPNVIRQLQEFRCTHTQDIRDKVLKMVRKAKGDITLSECADKLHYSANYLGRILRCENNDTFSDFVAEQKLEYAKSLLEETERSVADIARELNYANTQNFIRFFSKRVGMTPGKYRQSRKEEADILMKSEGK